MREPAGDPLAAELALDHIEAELAGELPGHVRGFARAHAAGRPPPPAPAVARRLGSLAIAERALGHPALADRARALRRLVAPIVIDDDPAVVAARAATPTWPALATLAAGRDAAARARCGIAFVELIHTLHGSGRAAPTARGWFEPGPAIAGWHDRGPAIGRIEIERVARELAARHGVTGSIEVVAAEAARPRAFVVDPAREVIVVVPAVVDTPAARFAVVHELGHAIAALGARSTLPRVIDEAAASYVARLLESETVAGWASPLAAAARARRTMIAGVLDRIERGLPVTGDRPARPPWALWHDPGAQAAYVAAEGIADRWWAELGPTPGIGALTRAIVETATALVRESDEFASG